MNKIWLLIVIFLLQDVNAEEQKVDPKKLNYSIQELRSSVGQWSVVTQFIGSNGEIAKEVKGTYSFDWTVKDRVISGRSDMPELELTSAILFYINEKKGVIEMVSVAADGKLWIMSGKLGDDSRETEYYAAGLNIEQKLKFTRFNVKKNSFESKMEYTQDKGKTWVKGNHQYFTRIVSS